MPEWKVQQRAHISLMDVRLTEKTAGPITTDTSFAYRSFSPTTTICSGISSRRFPSPNWNSGLKPNF